MNIETYLTDRKAGKNPKRPSTTFSMPKLEKLPADTKEYYLADENVKGLVCRVMPSGTKTLMVMKKPKGRNVTVKVTICGVGDLPLTKVRQSAQAHLYTLSQGINPNDQQREVIREEKRVKQIESAGTITLGQAFDEYKEYKTDLSAGTIQSYDLMILQWLKPWLDSPLNDILNRKFVTVEMPKHIQAHIQAKNQEERQTGHNACWQAISFLRTIVTTLQGEDMASEAGETFIKHWPLSKRLMEQQKKRFKSPSRNRHVEPENMPDWWQALHQLPDHFEKWGAVRTQGARKKHDGEKLRDLFLIYILTGMRHEEASKNLRWENVDFKTRTFLIPREDVKTSEQLHLPMTDYIKDILKRRHAASGEPQTGPVFNVTGRDVQAATEAIAKLCGLHRSPHDLRRTFKDAGIDAGIDKYITDILANHAKPKDTGSGYIHFTAKRLRPYMDKITNEILKQAGVMDAKILQFK